MWNDTLYEPASAYPSAQRCGSSIIRWQSNGRVVALRRLCTTGNEALNPDIGGADRTGGQRLEREAELAQLRDLARRGADLGDEVDDRVDRGAGRGDGVALRNGTHAVHLVPAGHLGAARRALGRCRQAGDHWKGDRCRDRDEQGEAA